jgi:hypothetical protein
MTHGSVECTYVYMYVCMSVLDWEDLRKTTERVKLASNVDKYHSGYLLHKIL